MIVYIRVPTNKSINECGRAELGAQAVTLLRSELLMCLGRLEIHIALSILNLVVRILAQDHCVVSLSLL